MQEVVNVNDKKVVAVEWNGERVITTAQLAEVYGATEAQIKQNYGNNSERFEEGKHFYFLKGNDLRDFKNRVENFDLVGKNANQLYLWTRRGASRHCKMLGTDKAWEQFDCLEENYFNRKHIEVTYQYPVSPSAMESATNTGRLFERIMRRECASPHEVAYVVRNLFSQAGIDVPECAVKVPAYEQLELSLRSVSHDNV